MKILQLAISLFLSVTTGIISSSYGFDPFQSVAVALLVFLSSEIIALNWDIGKINIKQKEENKFLDHVNPYSQKLEAINNYFYNISKKKHGNDDLFVVTCSRAIDNLYNLSKEADIESKIRISSDYLINVRCVFDALNTTKNKVIKLTFPIHEIGNSIIASPEDRKFFEIVYSKIKNKEVSELQLLIILDSIEMLKNEKLQNLFSFYAKNEKYCCKYILTTDFLDVCENNMIPKTSLDFGIYSSKMLFIVEKQEPYEGVYYKDEVIISRYNKMFDEIWSFEAITKNNPVPIAEKTGMTPKEFFESDI